MSTATLPHVTDEESGHRFYPIDGENFWSVSTATGVIGKEFLTFWSASLAAAFAFDELPTILSASMIVPCGRSYIRCKDKHDWRDPHIAGVCPCLVCEGCIRKNMSNLHDQVKRRRADEGKRTHHVIEWWAENNGDWRAHDPDIEPYIQAFKAFAAEYGITPDSFLMTERVVINRKHKYAGMTDGLLLIEASRTRAAAELVAKLLSKNTGEAITADEAAAQNLTVLVLIDFKTQDKAKEDEKFYPEAALQLGGGYRYAETVRIKNTEVEEPMPHTDGAMLIHLRPDGATPRLIVSDETTFEAFLMALGLFRWLNEFGTASVSVRSFPLPKPVKAVKSTARKAAQPASEKPPVKRAAPAKKAAPPAARPGAHHQRLADFIAGRPVNADQQRGAQLTDEMIPF